MGFVEETGVEMVGKLLFFLKSSDISLAFLLSDISHALALSLFPTNSIFFPFYDLNVLSNTKHHHRTCHNVFCLTVQCLSYLSHHMIKWLRGSHWDLILREYIFFLILNGLAKSVGCRTKHLPSSRCLLLNTFIQFD